MKTERRKAPSGSKRRHDADRRPTSDVGGKLLIMAAVVAAVIFGVAIFFKINTIEVQGNSIYSAEEIKRVSGIQKGDNLFTLNKEAAAGSIRANLPYVETVSVIRFLPDRVVIEVGESDAAFAIATNVNTVWLINSVGKALEQVTDATLSNMQTPEVSDAQEENAAGENGDLPSQPDSEPIPETLPSDPEQEQTASTSTGNTPWILGVSVNSPVAGSVVTAADTAKLNAALAVIAELDGTGILEHIESINVEKEYDIVLEYDGRYEIRLGGTDDLSYKVDYLTVILGELSDFQAGTIDLSFTDSSEARFYSKE